MKKARASVLTKYDSGGGQVVAASVRLGVDDLQLRASCSDRTFVRSAGLKGLTVGVEKPGSFVLEYDVHEAVPRFQFSGVGRLLNKDVQVSYTHQPKTRDALVVDGILIANPANKLHGRMIFPTNKGHVKMCYVHNGHTSIEPGVEFPSRAWNLGIAHKFPGNHNVKATYDHMVKTVGLAWSRDPENGSGACKISANVPLQEPKNVRVLMEKVWNFDF
ncbi:hypothetical protein SELMODRAFT_100718 [Selaginella moellendorffii]|uniref:Uncharacterized protein n=1 Tax=Selaginella moellendorffii TaxID=88036 RepID=D8RSB2_SELML|nr:hypothetical protein SELMODRAFT_100718 [Selaginella moellendorffii]